MPSASSTPEMWVFWGMGQRLGQCNIYPRRAIAFGALWGWSICRKHSDVRKIRTVGEALDASGRYEYHPARPRSNLIKHSPPGVARRRGI